MAITKMTFTVADRPVDAGWKKESASAHRRYPTTKSQITLLDRALFMITSGCKARHYSRHGPLDTSETTNDRFSDFCSAAANVCHRGEAEIFVRSESYHF